MIRSDDKRRARVGAMQTVLHLLPYRDREPAVATAPDPLIVGAVAEMFPLENRLMFGNTE